ncbi:uncharacterized protein A1O9_12002 [Exophiala aquamarina CBS 119918]|uniref:AB hydrolase-1 domain-containing protein n=1 Tax=Exophiala aquamarina CBS 119918 TaxID=1182545 RepID=A0A072NX58_9EURO|nr:uncharacterized protein A1O9_12002 [Exophiala aquamarina CBS 119918]KEF52012.1 hypothetical protein A1O9_12002 [Exophiala aquamarina CBS 119918]
MTSVSRTHLTLNGTNIHYLSSGKQQGYLAVLLHGLGASAEAFRLLTPSIPPIYHTISVDIEGFGKTPLNPEKPLSFARYVSDLHDVITHIQENSATPATNGTSNSSNGNAAVLLIGHSLGSIISLHYAARYPTEVAGLLLLGVGRSVSGIPPAQQRMRDLAAISRQNGTVAAADIAVQSNFPADRENQDVHVAEVRQAVSSCSSEAYAATAEVVASDDHLDPDYGLIKCPAVFVAGDKDMISPPQRSIDISNLLGGSTEVLVVTSGHQMIMQDLQGVKKALSALISKL